MFTHLTYTQKSSNTTPSVTLIFRVSADFYQQPLYNNPLQMNNETPQILQEQAIEIMDTIEDSVEYLCREHMLSGEKVWVMISALCDAKLKEFPDED